MATFSDRASPSPFQAVSPDVVSRKGDLFPLDPRQLLHGPQQCGVGRRRVRGGRDRLPRVLQPQQLLHEVREDWQVYDCTRVHVMTHS